ncbi:hypothetical protein [Geoalkalibacter halelectricus]|uniref:Pre-16S rRNA nuclease n=1 Tax=Geoalkalibacter halelectricus TaxID=2847045 RepID=A0ABY5ZJW9_9BACT|nr:hypothetical protein [Geoalkalibacter halelectricus]MDO3378191.1 hypothetical protein [Geoalkalibacter halelectricus]UWZ78034.1 hypothetical protein L9S41_10015 [Geoalkalibacter halelectricus]
MGVLLAVDLGLKTGLALYGADARLLWYRSHNFGTSERLKRAVHAILNDIPDLEVLVIEGGGLLAPAWEKEAARRGLRMLRLGAEAWRERLLLPREQRSGSAAKQHADQLARRVIAWSAAARPTSLRHDAAEAILIGLWGVLECGWLEDLPPALRR